MSHHLDTVRCLLEDLLVDEMFESIVPKSGMRCVHLKETAADARLKRVVVSGIPDKALLLKPENFEEPRSLFKGTHGERSRCDYLLMCMYNGKPILLFIEMKSSDRKKDREIAQQFKGAECLLDYCAAVLKRFRGEDVCFDAFEKRFVVLYCERQPLRKRPTRAPKPTVADSPDKPYRFAFARDTQEGRARLAALFSL